jgi:hypothetical protein
MAMLNNQRVYPNAYWFILMFEVIHSNSCVPCVPSIIPKNCTLFDCSIVRLRNEQDHLRLRPDFFGKSPSCKQTSMSKTHHLQIIFQGNLLVSTSFCMVIVGYCVFDFYGPMVPWYMELPSCIHVSIAANDHGAPGCIQLAITSLP